MGTALAATAAPRTAASSKATRSSRPLPPPASWPKPGGTNICAGSILNSLITAGIPTKATAPANTGMRSNSTGSANTTAKALISILRNLFPWSETSSNNDRLVTGTVDNRGGKNAPDIAVHDDIHEMTELFFDDLRISIFLD